MLVAFYLDNNAISNIDLRYPEKGNPGCGGTEFLFVALPYYLDKYQKEICTPIILANNIGHLPKHIHSVQVSDKFDAVKQAKKLECDFFIYRPRRNVELDFLCLVKKLNVPVIAWSHVTPMESHLRYMTNVNQVKAIVCVEHEQYDRVQDSPAHEKLTYIVNGFDLAGYQLDKKPDKEPGLVVYLGALVPQKGFHLLAKAWPKVLQKCSNAKLKVIGSGALYNEHAKLGPWGVAEEKYEINQIIPYLSDEQGRMHPSVQFMGRLGVEKKDLLYKAMVGVPNPSGHTENCPGSALEFQACETAVVSGSYYGLLDTVVHGETGLLGKTEDELVDNICHLVHNSEVAVKLGKQGPAFIYRRYNYEVITTDWIDLFQRLASSGRPRRLLFKENYLENYKWLVWINRYFQVVIGKFMFWPTLKEIRNFYNNILKAKNNGG